MRGMGRNLSCLLFLVISPEMKMANFSTWKSLNYRAGGGWLGGWCGVCVCVCGGGGGGGGDGISLTTVHSDFSSFLLLSPYKSILSITTKGGWLSGRIVIIILLMYNQMLYDNKQSTLCFEARRKCEVGFIHNQLASSYANVPQQLASSPSTVGFITRDFHALISRQHSQTNRRSLHTLFLTSKSQCMQKIRSVDALLTTQNVLSWSGRFGGGHTGWSRFISLTTVTLSRFPCKTPIGKVGTSQYTVVTRKLA